MAVPATRLAPSRDRDQRRARKDVQPPRATSTDSDDDDDHEMQLNEHSDEDDDEDEDEDDDDEDHEQEGSSQDEQDDASSSPPPQQQSYTTAVRSIAFGDLAEAQATLAPARERRQKPGREQSQGHTSEPSEKLQALRERLAELKQRKNSTSKKRKRTPGDDDADNLASADSQNDSDDDSSGPEEEKGRPHARSSKHAPAEQSSRYQVSRKRNITEVSGNPTHARDPRFVAATGHVDTNTIAKRYAFLGEYRDHELKELRDVLKATRDPDEKARLRLAVGRMENRARADRRREQQGEVLRQHRHQERERVKLGKKPFFLKRGDVKRQVVAEAQAALPGKERERLAKRRSQKAEQREKRQMPDLRRSAAA